MPRDGLQQYAPPPGTNGITNYTIESTKYNGFVADVTQDLNLPRPIVAGGTGANNAHDAMIALSGEIAGQLVTNYDTHPFVAGSFYSGAGATSQPSAGGHSGICYPYLDPNFITIEAREYVGPTAIGRLFVRQKYAGVWGAWAQQAGSTADLDAAYVNVTGDTMSGTLAFTGVAGSKLDWFYTGGNFKFNTSVVANSSEFITRFSAPSAYSLIYQFGSISVADGVTFTPKFEIDNSTVRVPITTPSTSPSTGALTVAGGVGIGGELYVAGSAGINGGSGLRLTAASGPNPNKYLRSDGAGNFQVLNNAFSAGIFRVSDNGDTWVNSTTASTSPTTGALTVAGGLGVAGGIIAGNARFEGGSLPAGGSGIGLEIFVQGGASNLQSFNRTTTTYAPLTIPATIASTSPTTGALTVAGGVGVNGSMFIGGIINTAFTGISTIGGVLEVRAGGYGVSASNTALRVACAGGGTQYGVSIRSATDGTAAILFTNSADTAVGQIAITSTNTSYVTSSARELKEDLKSFDAGNIVDNTNVYDFKWRSTGERSYGVIAQEANEVYPTAVTYSKVPKTITAEGKEDEVTHEDFWGVDYSKYVPVLLQEMKALRERVRDLEGRLDPKPA